MKPVTQEHFLGCGVACVAFLLRLPYQEVFDQMDKEKVLKKGILLKDMAAILAKHNKQYILMFVKSQTSIRVENSIVYIKKSPQYPAGHYLVYYKGLWMNSWINFPVVKPVLSGWQRDLPGDLNTF